MKKFFITVLTLILLNLYFLSNSFSDSIEEEAFSFLKEYIKINTVNPPGNESRAVDFYARIFDEEEIYYEHIESAPGRGNIWARIKGGNKPALMMLQHTDVVPADPKHWSVQPFDATEKDGFLYGRGTLDMKGTGITQLATFLSLKSNSIPLNRDVIFLATADEEAGGFYGVGWLIKNKPEIFKNVELLINEGGSGRIINNNLVFEIELTQKVPVWLKFIAVDTPGHGSSPRTSSSVTRLIDGLHYLKENPFPPRIISSVDEYFLGMSNYLEEEKAEDYRNIDGSIKRENFIKQLQIRSPFHHSLTRDTCSITRLGASNKINVVPPVAWAEIDCRILPDRTAEDFINEIKYMMKPFDIKVETIMAFTSASSTTESELYKTIKSTLKNLYPHSHIIPRVTTGFTDSHFTRDLGIQSYGFNPIIVPLKEFGRIHGNDERININAFKQGVKDHLAIIKSLVYD